MSNLPFNVRQGLNTGSPIDNDFPDSARRGLFCIINAMIEEQMIKGSWSEIRSELIRTSRSDYIEISYDICWIESKEMIYSMDWIKLFIFCERLYENLLQPKYEYVGANENTEKLSLQEVRNYYTKELNDLLLEENMGYIFENGRFIRRGRIQTQKSIERAGAVLIDPKLHKVKKHYNKALKYFNEKPNPENENCIKEAICALEACFEVLCGESVSKDFSREIMKFQGIEEGKIPPPIIQSMIKIFGYRGTGEGVAHGNTSGLRVTKIETELVLSLVASYITYLYDFFSEKPEETPF